MSTVLLIEGCDFESRPVGGQLTFAKQLLSVFGNRLALVGLASHRDQAIGRWTKRRIGEREFEFFGIGVSNQRAAKPLVPARLTIYMQLMRWRKAILTRNVRRAFILAPEVLLAVHDWGWDSMCFAFAGVSNPLSKPRYRWARLAAGPFERKVFDCLVGADAIIAAADDAAIDALVARSRGKVPRERINKVPTFVDADVFHPLEAKDSSGCAVERGRSGPVIVACGRLNRVKGWELIVRAFERLRERSDVRHAQLVFVGDGEDRPALEILVKRLGLQEAVSITGFVDGERVAAHLKRADVVVCGSLFEGWPTTIVEALACGKAIVSTDVSGVGELIVNGRNGFIVKERDSEQFARALYEAIHLGDVRAVSVGIAKRFDLRTMRERVGEIWSPLR